MPDDLWNEVWSSCSHEAMLNKIMQLTVSVIVKSVLLLLIDGNERNKFVKWENKYFLVL